ncbi:MAG: molybdopterin-dependent oxidoreductase [Gammaproteobacteria bacterium]|jgi:anaerobic selenocysteine-containing dehydrogenase|nr:molybdopterin-dependent oxidoreductase [Gammaproteobacteria bacterium]
MTTEHLSFCRFCHAFCPIKVTVENGRASHIIGDNNNTVYHGYTCKKGRQLPAQHYHPDRLLATHKRNKDGAHAPLAVEQAMDQIAEQLSNILERHGPRAIGMYTGTFSHHYPTGSSFAFAFMDAIGANMRFSPSTIDQPGKPMSVAFHGRWNAGPTTFADADTWMLVGANPLVSMWGGIPQFNPAKRLHEARKKGLKLIVIDPRRTDVAEKSEIFLQPRPGEDPTILAGLVRIIIEEGLVDEDFVSEHIEGFDRLKEAVDRYTPDYVEARADVPAEDLIAAARLFATGPKGMVTCGTGPNMAPRGTVTEYLVLVLNSICGRWVKEGEQIPNPFVFMPEGENKAQAEARPEKAYGYGEQMRVRGLSESAAGLPTSAAADEILLEGEGRIRALLVVGGNPMAAWPDQLRTFEAMQKLDLSVTLDIKLSATAKLCDFVIAPRLSLEAPSITLPNEALTFYGVSPGYPEPWGQFGPAVVEPPAGSDVIEEWEFFYGLAQRMGLQLVVGGRQVDMQNKPTSDEVVGMLAAHGRIPLEEVKKHPHGHVFNDPSIVAKPRDDNWSHLLDVGADEMMAELNEIRQEAYTNHGGYEGDPVFSHRLISRRMRNVYNSNGHDLDKLVKGNSSYNPAFMNPDDMTELQLVSGDVVEITSSRATILGIVEEAPDVRQGAVSMAHAWGDAPEHDDSVRHIGSNTGRLSDNAGRIDPRCGIPVMSAIPVNVRKAVNQLDS